ncbi:MAG: 50S ribosomal protein L40e [Thermoproteota archaeon]|nr:50S ribosomal protein L40e [Candidatus Brockarchaeota archaeon]
MKISDPVLIEIIKRRRLRFMICRKCGARNAITAKKCRKCHSKNLRPKRTEMRAKKG